MFSYENWESKGHNKCDNFKTCWYSMWIAFYGGYTVCGAGGWGREI